MRKIILVSALALAVLAAFVPISNAEMLKEGSSEGDTYYIHTWTVLPHEKERVQINYEVWGIHDADSESSIMHNTSTHCVGSVQAVRGVYKEMGLCTATRPDGDKIYITYEGTGQIGVGAKGTYKFVGGTGKLVGITGTGEFQRRSLKDPSKTHHASISRHKYNWKIP